MGGVREESVSGQGVGRLVGGEEFNGALKFMLIRVTHIAAISRSIRPSISFPLRVSSVHAMSDTLLTHFQLASISLKAKLKIVPWRQGCTQSGIFHAQSATLSWGGLTWVGCKKRSSASHGCTNRAAGQSLQRGQQVQGRKVHSGEKTIDWRKMSKRLPA